MARHNEFAALVGIDVYFADPHFAWQQPINEIGNGLVCRYVGKGTNLAIYLPADLRRIEHRINTTLDAASAGQPPPTSTLPLSR